MDSHEALEGLESDEYFERLENWARDVGSDSVSVPRIADSSSNDQRIDQGEGEGAAQGSHEAGHDQGDSFGSRAQFLELGSSDNHSPASCNAQPGSQLVQSNRPSFSTADSKQPARGHPVVVDEECPLEASCFPDISPFKATCKCVATDCPRLKSTTDKVWFVQCETCRVWLTYGKNWKQNFTRHREKNRVHLATVQPPAQARVHEDPKQHTDQDTQLLSSRSQGIAAEHDVTVRTGSRRVDEVGSKDGAQQGQGADARVPDQSVAMPGERRLDLDTMVHVSLQIEYNENKFKYEEVAQEVQRMATLCRKEVATQVRLLLDDSEVLHSDHLSSKVVLVSIINTKEFIAHSSEVEEIKKYLSEYTHRYKNFESIAAKEICVCQGSILGIPPRSEIGAQQVTASSVISFFSLDSKKMPVRALDTIRESFENELKDGTELTACRQLVGESVSTSLEGYLPKDLLQQPPANLGGSERMFRVWRTLNFFWPSVCTEQITRAVDLDAFPQYWSDRLKREPDDMSAYTEMQSQLGQIQGVDITDDQMKAILKSVESCFVFHYFRGSVEAVCHQAIPMAVAKLLIRALDRYVTRRRQEGRGRGMRARGEEREGKGEAGRTEVGTEDEMVDGGEVGEKKWKEEGDVEVAGTEVIGAEASKSDCISSSKVSVHVRPSMLASDKSRLEKKTRLLDLTNSLLCKAFGFAPHRVCMSRVACKRLRDQLLRADSLVIFLHASCLLRERWSMFTEERLSALVAYSGALDLRINTTHDRGPPARFQMVPCLPKLTALDLTSTVLDEAFCAWLGSLSKGAKLTSLKLQDCNLDDLARAAKSHNLISLLDGLESIRTLCLASNGLRDSVSHILVGLTRLTALTVLDISDNALVDESLVPIIVSMCSLPLRSFLCSNNWLSFANAQCRNVGFPSSLQTLDLARNKIETASGLRLTFDALRHCTQLTSLDLRGNAVFSEAPESRHMLFQLAQVHCSLRMLNQVSVTAPNKHLNLCSQGLSSTEMQLFSSVISSQAWRNLLQLNLSKNFFGQSGMECLVPGLMTLTQLRHLDLGHNGLQAAGVSHLMKAAGSLGLLRTLRVGANSIGAVGAGLLSPMMSQLRELGLSENKISSEGVVNLNLGAATALQLLDLSTNGIESDAAGCLANTIPQLASLRVLNLAKNYFVLEAEAQLAAAVSNMPNFRRLDIRDQITDPGCIDWERVWEFCSGKKPICKIEGFSASLRWAFPDFQTFELKRALHRMVGGSAHISRASFIQGADFRVAHLDRFFMRSPGNYSRSRIHVSGADSEITDWRRRRGCSIISRWWKRQQASGNVTWRLAKGVLDSGLKLDKVHDLNEQNLGVALVAEPVVEAVRRFLVRLVHQCWRMSRGVWHDSEPIVDPHVKAFLCAYRISLFPGTSQLEGGPPSFVSAAKTLVQTFDSICHESQDASSYPWRQTAKDKEAFCEFPSIFFRFRFTIRGRIDVGSLLPWASAPDQNTQSSESRIVVDADSNAARDTAENEDVRATEVGAEVSMAIADSEPSLPDAGHSMPSMRDAVEQVQTACGCTIGVGSRLQVRYDRDGRDVWWPCYVLGVVGASSEFMAHWRLAYDEIDGDPEPPEERDVVFCSRNLLADLIYGEEEFQDGLMQWRFDGSDEVPPPLLRAGEPVDVRCLEEIEKWLPGTVIRLNADGTYDVALSSGCQEKVLREDIAAGSEPRQHKRLHSELSLEERESSVPAARKHLAHTVGGCSEEKSAQAGGLRVVQGQGLLEPEWAAREAKRTKVDTPEHSLAEPRTDILGVGAGGAAAGEERPAGAQTSEHALAEDSYEPLFRMFKSWGVESNPGLFEDRHLEEMRTEFREEFVRLVRKGRGVELAAGPEGAVHLTTDGVQVTQEHIKFFRKVLKRRARA